RFTSPHPKDFRREVIAAMAECESVCEHAHLPLQSGSTIVLKAMRRTYSRERYLRLVDDLRGAIHDLALTTDIIVGFPGETEAHFQHTLDMLDELRFDVVHVAMYSPRPGTVSATEMVDDIPRQEKRRRLHEVEQLQKRIAAEINTRYLGRTVDVLVEGTAKGRWYGRTRTNKLVHFESAQPLAGRVVDVEVTATQPWYLEGALAKGMFSTEPLLILV
ncbi:MAG TPA: radical SAM protein, partial [Chloroflexota bacterium]|nr:radical SAM protein [Chloroflexota bacterium]